MLNIFQMANKVPEIHRSGIWGLAIYSSNAMHKNGIWCRKVRPSVYLSVTTRYYVIFKRLSMHLEATKTYCSETNRRYDLFWSDLITF